MSSFAETFRCDTHGGYKLRPSSSTSRAILRSASHCQTRHPITSEACKTNNPQASESGLVDDLSERIETLKRKAVGHKTVACRNGEWVFCAAFKLPSISPRKQSPRISSICESATSSREPTPSKPTHKLDRKCTNLFVESRKMHLPTPPQTQSSQPLNKHREIEEQSALKRLIEIQINEISSDPVIFPDNEGPRRETTRQLRSVATEDFLGSLRKEYLLKHPLNAMKVWEFSAC